MTKLKIGLAVMGLLGAVACGDSGGGDDTDTTAGTNTGGGGTAGANATNSTGDSTNNTGDSTNNTGSNANGGTNSGTTNGSTGSDDDAGTTGSGGTDACLNDADQAILADLSVAQLACEGAACAGKNIDIANIGIDEAKTATCVSSEAPNLKNLTPACQECFVGITLCVPKSCVMLLGGSSDACSMGLSLPNTDFAMCDSPAAPSDACNQCQMDNCEAAFVACSGIES